MSYADECREFVTKEGDGLQRALIAGFGREVGQEALSEALAYAWVHWERVRSMENRAGYLYRVGYRWALRARTRHHPVIGADPVDSDPPSFEPTLPDALRALTERQRTAVVLVEGYAWTYADVAVLMGLSRGAVETHVRRGMRKLRKSLGVNFDV